MTVALTDVSLAGKKDETYFWENVCFSVEGYLFQIPKHQFVQGSEYFTEKYELLKTVGAPVKLNSVTAEEFRTFLRLLFPIHSTSTTATFTKEEWSTILTLSTLWNFHDFRKLAIQHLDPYLTDPVELVQMGRAAFVPRWVLSGYEALIQKSEVISEDECDLIGDRTAVRLYIIRHVLTEALLNVDAATLPGFVGRELHTRFADEIEALDVEEQQRHTKAELEQERKAEEEAQRRDEEHRTKVAAEEKEARQRAEEMMEGERKVLEVEQRRLEVAEAQKLFEETEASRLLEAERSRREAINLMKVTKKKSRKEEMRRRREETNRKNELAKSQAQTIPAHPTKEELRLDLERRLQEEREMDDSWYMGEM